LPTGRSAIESRRLDGEDTDMTSTPASHPGRRYLITGASGGFGRTAVRLLLERVRPQDLILVTRSPESVAEFAHAGAEVRAGDFDEPGTLREAFAGADRMLLISTLSAGRRAAQHTRAIEAAAEAGIGHIVYTSSDGSVPGNPAVVAPDHLGTEQALASSGVHFTIMRDSLYSEAAAMMMAAPALATGQFRTAAGDGRVGFIPRDECVACAVEVLTSDGHAARTYRVANEQNWSFRDVAELTAEIFGREIEYVELTVEERDAELQAAGLPDHYTPGLFTAGFGASARDDIVSYEHGVRENFFTTTSTDVRGLIGRPPTLLPDFLRAWREPILEHSGRF
jgi:NAD(P)H dehydrogenase (quinone)